MHWCQQSDTPPSDQGYHREVSEKGCRQVCQGHTESQGGDGGIEGCKCPVGTTETRSLTAGSGDSWSEK